MVEGEDLFILEEILELVYSICKIFFICFNGSSHTHHLAEDLEALFHSTSCKSHLFRTDYGFGLLVC